MAQEVITLAKQETSEEILEIVKGIRTTTGNIQTGLNGIDNKLLMDGKIWTLKKVSDSIENSFDTSSRTLFSVNSISNQKRLFISARIKIAANYANTESSNNAWSEIQFNGVKIARLIPIGNNMSSELGLFFLTDESTVTDENGDALGGTITKEYTKSAYFRYICTAYPTLKNLRLYGHARNVGGSGYIITISWEVIYLEEESKISMQ